mmetsp:Transcript_8112/g.16532  ORF Transcript_8112/g.16532 Transcript_8112/m.16532 type:complete len:194 (-) Transcript_8112:128-709(-)
MSVAGEDGSVDSSSRDRGSSQTEGAAMAPERAGSPFGSENSALKPRRFSHEEFMQLIHMPDSPRQARSATADRSSDRQLAGVAGGGVAKAKATPRSKPAPRPRGGRQGTAAANEQKRRVEIRKRIDLLRSLTPASDRVKNMVEVLDDTVYLILQLVELLEQATAPPATASPAPAAPPAPAPAAQPVQALQFLV